MEIRTVPGPIQESNNDTLILSLFDHGHFDQTTAALDQALNGAVRDLLDSGDFSGQAEQVAVLYPHGAIPARRVILVGLGAEAEYDVEAARRHIQALGLYGPVVPPPTPPTRPATSRRSTSPPSCTEPGQTTFPCPNWPRR